MLIGAMNNPGRPLAEQIQWLGKMDFDFLDLTLEPPHAASWKIDAPALKRLLEEAVWLKERLEQKRPARNTRAIRAAVPLNRSPRGAISNVIWI